MAGLRRLLVLLLPATLLVLAAYSNTAISQPTDELQPRFTQVIVQVRQAEAAGARSSEVADLLVLLNKGLQLNDQALKLTRPDDAQRRAELLVQLNEMLDTVQAKANQLESVAAQRTFTNKLLAYVSGGVGAFVVTLAYAYGVSLWRKYRIKRTFQMKVVPK